MRRSLFVVAAFLFASAACSGDSGNPVDPDGNGGGGGGGGGGTSPADTIYLNPLTFEQSNLTVAPGREVVFVNRNPIFHTVTPDGHSAWTRTETSSAGIVLRVTITTPGTYNYFCEPHRSTMTGSLTVRSS